MTACVWLQYAVVKDVCTRTIPTTFSLEKVMSERGSCGQVLTEADCTRAVGLIWDFLEAMKSGIDRTDINTWAAPHWPAPPSSGELNSTFKTSRKSGKSGGIPQYCFSHFLRP